VVVILALMTSVGIPLMMRTLGTSDGMALAQRFIASDRRWRERSGDGPIRVTISPRGWSAGFLDQQQPFDAVQLPGALTAACQDASGTAVSGYLIDPRGRSRDLTLILQDGRRGIRMELLGLTGEWNAVPERGRP
jgi:hypothetical protein